MDAASVQRWLRTVLSAGPESIERLSQFVAMIEEENHRQNLVAASSISALWQRHILDSAQLLRVPRETVGNGSWLDLGTGAGFPGIVIAVLRPTEPIVLAESRRLRAEWLQRVAVELALSNVSVHHGRVEHLRSAPFAVISARAFAPLERLLQVASRFSTPESIWLLPKGARAAQELAELPAGWKTTFHVEQSLTEPTAGIIAGRVIEQPTTHRNLGSSA